VQLKWDEKSAPLSSGNGKQVGIGNVHYKVSLPSTTPALPPVLAVPETKDSVAAPFRS
jgi:hypothetical protein